MLFYAYFFGGENVSGSNTFGGTIKLEGEKEYRRAISQINSDLKVLASEMGKVTAEFGKNNKSASSLSSQSKVLNEQIRNQKEKISTLKGALQEASEKYGENDKRTNTWRTSLNKAETELTKMEKNLSDVNSEMTKSQSPLEKLTTKISEQEKELKSLQTEYKNVVLEQSKNSAEAKELATQIKDLNGDIKENKNKLNEAEQATDELGNEMDETAKQTNIFGEVLKANLAADFIKVGIEKIVDGFKKIKEAVISYVNTGIELSNAETENRQKLLQVMQNTMDARLEDAQSIEALISSQEKLGVVSKTVQLGGAQELSTYLTKRETLEKLIPVMNDMIAQQYGINASQESAANIATMLGKVMDGQTGALSRYGYKFDEAQEKILKYGTEEERCAVLTEVITSSIGGMNEALGQTDAGKMAQLSAALENTQVRIGEIANEIKLSFAPMLSEIGNKAYDVGDSFGKLVESIISGDDDLSEEISNFKETVKILITEIRDQMPAFLELGGQIISAIGEGLWAAIEPFAAQIAGWGLVIVGAIIALGPPISAAISAVMAVVGTAIAAWPVALGIALAGLVVAFWPQISKFFSDLWDGIVSWCSDIWSKIKDFLSEHWQDVLLWIVSWPVALIKTLADFWPQISAWLSGLWDNIMSAMEPMFNWFRNIGDEIGSFVGNAMNYIKELLVNSWNSIISFFTETIPAFIESVIEWFRQLPYNLGFVIGKAIGHIIKFGLDLWNFATVTVPEFISQVITFFSQLPSKIWAWLVEATTKLKQFFADMVILGITKTTEFITNVINFIKELPGKSWEWLQNTMRKISEFFANAVNTAKTKANEFLSNVINVIRNLPSQIASWLSNAVQKVISWGSDMVSKGRQAASDLFSAIVNKVREIPSQMLSIGSNIVSGIWSGISGSIGWITSKVREFARGILDGIKSALGIHSPSTVFEQEVGKNMALGVGEGFVNAMDNVKREMQEAIPTNFDTDLNMLPSSANSISNIKNTSEAGNNGVFGKLDSILSLLAYYIPALQNRQLCLDTGVLVGELTPPINRELARIEMSKERGR